jgi:hypothetical protein
MHWKLFLISQHAKMLNCKVLLKVNLAPIWHLNLGHSSLPLVDDQREESQLIT